jgi:hypothetical protein
MSVVLETLTKRYEDHPVVANLSLEIADGEFFVLTPPRWPGGRPRGAAPGGSGLVMASERLRRAKT